MAEGHRLEVKNLASSRGNMNLESSEECLLVN